MEQPFEAMQELTLFHLTVVIYLKMENLSHGTKKLKPCQFLLSLLSCIVFTALNLKGELEEKLCYK